MSFTLPALPHAYDAFEPKIDQLTMEIHHTKHHQAYVTNLNTALADYPELQSFSLEELLSPLAKLPVEVQTAVRNQGGGHANHSFFWTIITPEGTGVPLGELAKLITQQFGSFADFKTEFSMIATKCFGSGWAWLVLDENKKLQLYSTANQDSPLMQHHIPLIGLDLWEHAYYLKYQNRRPEYIAAFWEMINWAQAERILQENR